VNNWKKITLTDLESLPVGYQQRISESYLDDFKHMNVMLWTFTHKRQGVRIHREK